MTEDLMQKIVSLAKRRGFVFPGSEIYGGLANTWDFGPYGLLLRKNIKDLWWQKFVSEGDNIYPIGGGIILSPKVWEASGHVENFTDPLVECKKCHHRFRADQLEDTKECPDCGGELTEPRAFNGMFRTFVGATEEGTEVYLRPETAQAIFINFKNIVDTYRPKLPFGIAQIGKAFRNEITAGNFIFRDIEFEQMELEYFVRPEDWEKAYDFWLSKMHDFARLLGLYGDKIHEREHAPEERSHYSKKTIDLEFDFPFGRKELWGLAYRTDYDLRTHSEKSGVDLSFTDESGEKFYPHVIEPSLGVDRSMMAVLAQAYTEDKDRVVMKFAPRIAPVKVAIFPLVANKPELVKKAREIYTELKKHFMVVWDDRGNIGKRYYAQDEVGTPWCITVDYQTIEEGENRNTVTVRDRDTTLQERKNADTLVEYFTGKLAS